MIYFLKASLLLIVLSCSILLASQSSTPQATSSLQTDQDQPKEKKEPQKEFSLTLGTILNLSKDIASHKPSSRIAPVSGKDILIKGSRYEIRFFFFEGKSESLSKDITFEGLINEKGLLTQSPKIMDQGYGPILFFTAPPELHEKGIFYMLALRHHPE